MSEYVEVHWVEPEPDVKGSKREHTEVFSSMEAFYEKTGWYEHPIKQRGRVISTRRSWGEPNNNLRGITGGHTFSAEDL